MIAGTALERPPAALPAPSGSPDAVRAKPLKPAAQHAFSSSQGGAAASDRCVANRASARRPRAGGGESPVPPGLVGGVIALRAVPQSEERGVGKRGVRRVG